jgi:hypothetical protein
MLRRDLEADRGGPLELDEFMLDPKERALKQTVEMRESNTADREINVDKNGAKAAPERPR